MKNIKLKKFYTNAFMFSDNVKNNRYFRYTSVAIHNFETLGKLQRRDVHLASLFLRKNCV